MTTSEFNPEEEDDNFQEIHKSTIERLQHHCDLIKEDLEDVVIVSRRKFKYSDGSVGYQTYYAAVGDAYVNAQSLNSISQYFQKNLEEIVYEEIIPMDDHE